MTFLLDFFTRGHDVRFVALAAVICLVAAYACVTLLRHAGRVHGRIKLAWIGVASLSVGFGIWATHFVAMLAFQPGFELHYDIGLTAISLLLAIVICGAGLTLSILGNGLRDNLLGGAVVGVGISSMHYMGIFALVMGGSLQWNGAAVGLSIIAGIILSAAAMAIAGSGLKHRNTFGALVLTLAICVMHFTAMAAADFSNCFPTIANGSQAESGLMAFVVAFISLLLLAAAFGSAILDEADRRRTEREKDRQLADAKRIAEVSDKLELALTHMGQGLALFGADGKVELSNSRFVALLGLAPSTDVIGSDLNDICRLAAAVTTRVTYGDAVLNIAGSIGVAIFPDDGADRSKLLNNADLAMYRAKSEFDQRVCYYEREMDEHARQRRAMAADIWQALEKDAFTLAYQVQKSVSTQEITGYEVLLRWDRPGFGPVSPADFIPVAEECGAIGAIGNWVLKTACAEAASWPEPHKIAVNVSGLQLGQLELVDMVKMVLFQSGLDPSRLELEVTETAIISDKRRALHILRQIKALGVSIAIDDFGTGYSSLETLRSFPFDKIKLDRSFMDQVETNEQSKAIIRAILALGRSLHVPVLAEGVETTAQLDVLRLEGCNEAQGYLLGRPGRIDWDDLIDLPMRA